MLINEPIEPIEFKLEPYLYYQIYGEYFTPFFSSKKKVKVAAPKRNILKEYLRRVWFFEIF